jgi:hypothetical protein
MYSNIKSDENQSSDNRVVPCGQTGEWMNGQTDVTKQIVVFRNFANAHKNEKKTNKSYVERKKERKKEKERKGV